MRCRTRRAVSAFVDPDGLQDRQNVAVHDAGDRPPPQEREGVALHRCQPLPDVLGVEARPPDLEAVSKACLKVTTFA